MRYARLGTLVMIALAACGRDSIAPNADLVGSYALTRVGESSLPSLVGPAVVGPPTVVRWYVRGSIALRPDGSYTETVIDSSNSAQLTTVVEVGTWLQFAADSVRFTSSTANRESSAGNVVGVDLARRHQTRVFRFRR